MNTTSQPRISLQQYISIFGERFTILEIVESLYNAISLLIASNMSEEQVQNNLQVSTQIP